MDRQFVGLVFYVVTTALCGGIIRVFVPLFLPIAVFIGSQSHLHVLFGQPQSRRTLAFFLFGAAGMREPYLYSKLKDKLGEPAAGVKVVKEKYRDMEVYDRLDPVYYLVVFFKTTSRSTRGCLPLRQKT
jgi:hypothetical protein